MRNGNLPCPAWPRATPFPKSGAQVALLEVEPAKQYALTNVLIAEAGRWMRHWPGFVSATFHASLDGRHVTNYAQWRTKADFHGFIADPRGAVNRRRPRHRPRGRTLCRRVPRHMQHRSSASEPQWLTHLDGCQVPHAGRRMDVSGHHQAHASRPPAAHPA